MTSYKMRKLESENNEVPCFEVKEHFMKYCTATFTWDISNYLGLHESTPIQHLAVCNLKPHDQREYSFYLICGSALSLEIRLITYGNDKLENTVTLSVIDDEGEKEISTQPGPVVAKSIRFDNFYRMGHFHSKFLTIICTFSFCVDKMVLKKNSQISINQVEEMSEDFKKLLENKNLSDVILQVNGEQFKAHRNILAARSSVFSAMFSHETLERERGIVEITDIEPEILKTLLGFIYTGQIQDIENQAHQLLSAADKYSLEGLKQICEDVICRTLNVENAVDTLILADLHSTPKLKEMSLNFIKSNLKNVILTQTFSTLKNGNAQLLEDIIKSIV